MVFDILKSLNLRHRGVNVISCPSCARQGFNVIETVERLEERLAHITTPMSLSVIGCVVNGPGEARETDIGFTGGGAGKTHGMVYLGGDVDHKIENDTLVDHLVGLVEQKAAEIEAEKSRRGCCCGIASCSFRSFCIPEQKFDLMRFVCIGSSKPFGTCFSVMYVWASSADANESLEYHCTDAKDLVSHRKGVCKCKPFLC